MLIESLAFDMSFPQSLSGDPEAIILKTTGFPINNFGNDRQRSRSLTPIQNIEEFF